MYLIYQQLYFLPIWVQIVLLLSQPITVYSIHSIEYLYIIITPELQNIYAYILIATENIKGAVCKIWPKLWLGLHYQKDVNKETVSIPELTL